MIVFDTETTGLLPSANSMLDEYPHMIEFAAIKLDHALEEVNRIEFMVNPGIPIPQIIAEITGIKDEDVKNAPPFALHFNSLVDFFSGEEVMVAHNIFFDEMILETELKRIGKERCFPWSRDHICTIEATQNMPGVRKSRNGRFKLTELHLELTGTKHENAHRAMDDVEALVRCVRILNERHLI